ncbi:hypothetical protein MJ_0948 [Methanocaldococcus jannaschii DSM 2661]|uniref:Uncharacterized protein MJ0948 n=2 Tax=Methanocaldococcus jannaschii TaxID=2190 RepID=Y948_METJA|nr:RecName: Full=Uncharacterized protein MJ0948 [Methanocaldococcus jannaschii DSM 2661]AAB98956.1 hypothetical protein MJ_0948 [Methanocaldococcus jannaschii DSM 2661]
MIFMKNSTEYPTLVEIKDKKGEMIEKGEAKLRDLNNIRVKLNELRTSNPDDLDTIAQLEEEESHLTSEVLKLDLSIKILEVVEYIIESNIFEDYWKIIEEKIPYEELLNIVVENGLSIKKTCMELYKLANIDDKNILKKIQNLPDDYPKETKEDPNLQNKYLSKIISRISRLKEFKSNLDEIVSDIISNMR